MLTPRYHLEFVLNTQNISHKTLYNSLIEYGKGLEITPGMQDDSGKGKNFKINIETEDPTIIFDICSQFGRLKSVKVNEERRH
jgi:dihydroxyacetone kinase-like predicted kinase